MILLNIGLVIFILSVWASAAKRAKEKDVAGTILYSAIALLFTIAFLNRG